VLFHFSILTSSTDLGGAVWARKIGSSAKAKISAIGEIVEIGRFVIPKLLQSFLL
jgi:hypothetical protein